ncbi:MAG: DHHA1 domain-containing protein [Nitrospira sp.]|nr:DHHA1 domain-containing protein [Nitrospira sp.]
MYKDTGTTKDDVEDFINLPRSIIGVEVAVLFRESNSDWKISMRSNGKIDVSSIALEFGGGGHSMAAGCLIKGTLEEVKNKVVGRIEKAVINSKQ